MFSVAIRYIISFITNTKTKNDNGELTEAVSNLKVI